MNKRQQVLAIFPDACFGYDEDDNLIIFTKEPDEQEVQ